MSPYEVAKASRLARICDVAGLKPHTPPEQIQSYSNDTWILDLPTGEAILRIGWSGDITRLSREVAVTQDLPPEFPYPHLLDSGTAVLDDTTEESLAPEHPVHRLRALVDGRWPADGALPRSLLG